MAQPRRTCATCARDATRRVIPRAQDRKHTRAGITCMRRMLDFVLWTAVCLAAITGTARAQAAVSAEEAATCFGFSFGPWTPPLDWHASGHERTPDSITVPLASGGRGWAAELSHPDQDGTMLIFPSWWPVGVKIALPARALVRGDTVNGRATALVGNGFVTPSRAEVRAWLVPCGSSRGQSARLAPAGATNASTSGGAPIGTWRGTSTCLSRQGQSCGSDSVAYRIVASDSTTDSLSLQTSVIAAHRERRTGELRCRYEAFASLLTCDAPNGVLRLAVRGTELGGRLTRRDGVDLRYVHVRRVPPRER